MEEVIHPVEEVIHTLVILESAQGPNPSFFLFIRVLFDLGACWDQDLDQGLTIKIAYCVVSFPLSMEHLNKLRVTIDIDRFAKYLIQY